MVHDLMMEAVSAVYNDMDWWTRTCKAACTTLFIWAIVGFVIPAFSNQLRHVTFLSFPLNYYIGAQVH